MFGLVVLFIGYFITTGTGLIDSSTFKNVMRLVGLSLFLINIVLFKAVKINILMALTIMLMLVFINNNAVAFNIIYLILIALSLRNLTKESIVTVLLVSAFAVVFAHIFFLQAGYITDTTYEYNNRSRSTLGFTNPNQVSAIYLSLTFISILSVKVFDKFKFKIISFLALTATLYVVSKTDSRTTLYALLFISLFEINNFFFHSFKSYNKIISFAGLISPLVATVITIILTNLAGTELDQVLSYRPYFFHEFISEVTYVDLIIGWVPKDNAGVDSLFLTLLSGVGIAAYLIIIAFFSIKIFKLDAKYTSITITLIIVSIFESYLIRPELPISILFVTIILAYKNE